MASKRKSTRSQKKTKTIVRKRKFNIKTLNFYMKRENNKFLKETLAGALSRFKTRVPPRSKAYIVNNIYEYMMDAEIEYCKTKLGARVIRRIIPLAPREIHEEYVAIFYRNVRILSKDKHGHQVLEKLIVDCQSRLTHQRDAALLTVEGDHWARHKSIMEAFFIAINSFFLSNFHEFVYDRTGCSVVASCIGNLRSILTSVYYRGDVNRHVYPRFQRLVEAYGERILLPTEFHTICTNACSNTVVNAAVKTLHVRNQGIYRRFLNQLVNRLSTIFNSYSVLPGNVFTTHTLYMRLLDTCLRFGSLEDFRIIYESIFRGKLVQMVFCDSGFYLYSLFDSCTGYIQNNMVLDELEPGIPEIVRKRYSDQIVTIGRNCTKYGKQRKFAEGVMKGLNCFTPENRKHFILALARFKPYNPNKLISTDYLADEKLNGHFDHMIRLMLNLRSPVKCKLNDGLTQMEIDAWFGMETDTLKKLLLNKEGSCIASHYLNQKLVTQNMKDTFVRRMLGTCCELVTRESGSSALKEMWEASNLDIKCSIMEELLSNSDQTWSNTLHGKVFADETKLSMYIKNKTKWKKAVKN